MNTYLSSAQLKDLAKERLSGHYGFLIGTSLVVGLITYALTSLLTLFVAANTLYGFLLGQGIRFCLSVFVGIFNAGLALIYLKFACGASASFSDIFYGFSNRFDTALVISLMFNALSLLPSLAYILANAGIYTGKPILILLSLPLLAVMLCIYIPLWLCLSQCFYLMLDFPDKSPNELISLSFRIMRGHRGRLFYIRLSFLPLIFLGLLSIIGTLWISPYIQMTMAVFYFDIMKPAQKN